MSAPLPPQPALRYPPGSDAIRVLHPSARTVRHAGRSGLNFTSIHGRAAVTRHLVDNPRGAVALWVLPLQELFPATQHPEHRKSNPLFDHFVFLSDREAVQDVDAANFAFYYHSSWHPVFMAKFAASTLVDATFCAQVAIATAGHFEFRALRWYHLVVTWDHEKGESVIYANGVKVGHSDASASEPLPHETPAPYLYFGNPAYAMGDLSFFDRTLSGQEVAAIFAAESTQTDPDLQRFLAHTYGGENLPEFSWQPSAADGWKQELALALDKQDDLIHFFQQGAGPCVRWSEEGMRVTTPEIAEFFRRQKRTVVGKDPDMTRVYFWTRRMFEGDLYVTVEFKLHRHGGLALLMTQAAGMQGEDFLDDYPLRSDGSMRVVCWEDVRNYHWEFYREMVDVRNDLVSHAVLKNPWFRPVNFQIENRTWELDRWYRLTYLQEDNRLRGAIDRVTVMDALDNGFENNGPVLRHGHVALRAMMRTDITFRHLEIWNRPHFETAPL